MWNQKKEKINLDNEDQKRLKKENVERITNLLLNDPFIVESLKTQHCISISLKLCKCSDFLVVAQSKFHIIIMSAQF
jgi:hypothetical protein